MAFIHCKRPVWTFCPVCWLSTTCGWPTATVRRCANPVECHLIHSRLWTPNKTTWKSTKRATWRVPFTAINFRRENIQFSIVVYSFTLTWLQWPQIPFRSKFSCAQFKFPFSLSYSNANEWNISSFGFSLFFCYWFPDNFGFIFLSLFSLLLFLIIYCIVKISFRK